MKTLINNWNRSTCILNTIKQWQTGKVGKLVMVNSKIPERVRKPPILLYKSEFDKNSFNFFVFQLVFEVIKEQPEENVWSQKISIPHHRHFFRPPNPLPQEFSTFFPPKLAAFANSIFVMISRKNICKFTTKHHLGTNCTSFYNAGFQFIK